MKSLITVSIAMLMLVTGRSVAGQNDSKPPITIALTVETPAAKTGATVSIRAVLTNNSKQPLDASGCYCGPSGLDSLFTWEVRDNGHLTTKKVYPHPELATGSAILDRIIQPGGEISGDQDISRLYDMAQPGKYVIQASRAIPKEMGGAVVKSNAVTVTVTQTYETDIGGGTPPIPTVQSELPNTLTAVVITSDYYGQPKTLVLHALNNSGKDITGYHITIRNKNPDRTVRLPDRKTTRQDMLRTLVAPTSLERTEAERVFPIFAAGTARDITFYETNWPDVVATFDVIFYADGTFDEQDDAAFKEMLADRQRAYLAIKKAIEIAKNALGDPTNDHPAATAIAGLAKAAAESMTYFADGPYDTGARQQNQFQWEIQALHFAVQREQTNTTERERLAQYVEDQEKRIASMTPHCHLGIALK